MTKISRKNLPQIKEQKSLLLDNLIKKGQWAEVTAELNRICQTIPVLDEIVGSEFVSAVLQEATDEYGTDEYVSAGQLYFEDFQELETREKQITTSCGETVTVNVVTCNTPYDSQVVEYFKDYLILNNKKVLSINIGQEELTKQACGIDTFNKLRDLIISRAQLTIRKLIRDIVYCYINDSRNYKEIVEIPYTCNDCEGDNIISAILNFSRALELDAKKYNIAGRDYELPRETNQWLVKSRKLESKIDGIMASKFNSSLIDINSKFARTFNESKLTIADGIIMDRQWIQIKQVMDKVYWEFNGKFLRECGNYHLWLKSKAINFLAAVPFRLVKVSEDDMNNANALDEKIQAISADIIEADTQDEAETAIKAKIDALNTSDPKLNLTYTFSDFKAPTDSANGSIKVSVDIKNANGTLLTTSNTIITLKKK